MLKTLLEGNNPAHNLHMYYVYLIESRKTGKLYIGFTPDLRDRLYKHNTGKVRSTKAYIPYELIYYEAYKSKKDAMTREHNLKYFGQGFSRLKEKLRHSITDASFVRGIKSPRPPKISGNGGMIAET